MAPEISIVIPAFEEEARLGDSVRRLLAFMSEINVHGELIVVDDGSKDATAETAKSAMSDFPHISSRVIRYEENRGKGFAVKTGLLAANADIAVFTDADLSTPITEMPKLTGPIVAGELDVTFGSRAIDRSLIGTHQPWRREQGGKV